jgi:Putative Actinobacterial Holin-X, holin superfamily III
MTVVAETVESEDKAEERTQPPSATELLVRLGRDVSVLAFCEAQLAASRNMPEVRRAARDLAAAIVTATAFLTAFVFVNVAAYYGLSSVVDGWVAALILGVAWIVIGSVLLVALLVRAGHVTGWSWWRVFRGGQEEALRDLERARDEAEVTVHETIQELVPVFAVELASAAVPAAGAMASGVVDAGQDILETSDQIVEALAEDLPGGGVVNQVWDVVLMPGRFGLKVATTVFKKSDES